MDSNQHENVSNGPSGTFILLLIGIPIVASVLIAVVIVVFRCIQGVWCCGVFCNGGGDHDVESFTSRIGFSRKTLDKEKVNFKEMEPSSANQPSSKMEESSSQARDDSYFNAPLPNTPKMPPAKEETTVDKYVYGVPMRGSPPPPPPHTAPKPPLKPTEKKKKQAQKQMVNSVHPVILPAPLVVPQKKTFDFDEAEAAPAPPPPAQLIAPIQPRSDKKKIKKRDPTSENEEESEDSPPRRKKKRSKKKNSKKSKRRSKKVTTTSEDQESENSTSSDEESSEEDNGRRKQDFKKSTKEARAKGEKRPRKQSSIPDDRAHEDPEKAASLRKFKESPVVTRRYPDSNAAPIKSAIPNFFGESDHSKIREEPTRNIIAPLKLTVDEPAKKNVTVDVDPRDNVNAEDIKDIPKPIFGKCTITDEGKPEPNPKEDAEKHAAKPTEKKEKPKEEKAKEPENKELKKPKEKKEKPKENLAETQVASVHQTVGTQMPTGGTQAPTGTTQKASATKQK